VMSASPRIRDQVAVTPQALEYSSDPVAGLRPKVPFILIE